MERHLNSLLREVVDIPVPGSIQGHIGWGFEQPGLLECDPAHGGGLVLHGL